MPFAGDPRNERIFDRRRDVVLGAIDLDSIDLLTLDVFDTTLFRLCGGLDDLFVEIERAASAEGLLNEACPPGAFPFLRRRAERAAREKVRASFGHGEVTLEAIYAEWPGTIGCGERLSALELETERANLRVNPYVLDLSREAARLGIRCWLVSDTYLTAERLGELLTGCGVGPREYDRLIVSCEHAAAKEDGRLFDVVEREAGATGGSWLHLGDNPVSDVSVPLARGIRAVHYRVPSALRRVEEREALSGRSRPSAARRIVARDHGETGPDAVWFDLGRLVIGPAIRAFCATVARSCRERGIRRVVPFLREGAVFSPIIAEQARRLGWAVDARPLAISREALIAPTAPERPNERYLLDLARDGGGKTVDDAARLLGLAEAPPPRLVRFSARVAGDTRMADLPSLGDGAFEEFAAIVASEGNRVAEHLARSRAAAVAYFERELGDDPVVATVDLGARGTIASALGGLPGIGDRRIFHHHLFYATSALLERLADGHLWFPFSGLEPEALERSAAVYRSPQLLELALIGTLPTTVGYRLGARGIEPVTAPASGDAEQARKLAICRRGIEHAGAVLDALADLGIVEDPGEERRRALDAVHRLIRLPLPEEARAASELTYDFNGGARGDRALIDETAIRAVADLDVFPPASIPTIADGLRPVDCPWPRAVVTLRDPDALVRLHEAVADGARHAALIRLSVEALLREGVARVILCGAGGAGGLGPAFIERAASGGPLVEGYFDYFDQDAAIPLPASIPTLRLADLADRPPADFAIVSPGYGDHIARLLEVTLQPLRHGHRIWSPPFRRR